MAKRLVYTEPGGGADEQAAAVDPDSFEHMAPVAIRMITSRSPI
jgi:hypothetical protein